MALIRLILNLQKLALCESNVNITTTQFLKCYSYMTVNNSPIFFKKRTNILINFSNISNNFFSQFSSQNMKKEKKRRVKRGWKKNSQNVAVGISQKQGTLIRKLRKKRFCKNNMEVISTECRCQNSLSCLDESSGSLLQLWRFK